MQASKRIAAASLGASAALITAIALHEGFDPVATRPVPNDPLTYGHGATRDAQGLPLEEGMTITRKEARALLTTQVNDDYAAHIRECAGDVLMEQHEFDAVVDLAYNIGWPKVCSSTMLREFRAGNYEAGCRAIFFFDRLHGRKCSLPENRNRKDGCRGIMARRDKQFAMCMGVR